MSMNDKRHPVVHKAMEQEGFFDTATADGRLYNQTYPCCNWYTNNYPGNAPWSRSILPMTGPTISYLHGSYTFMVYTSCDNEMI